MPPAPLPLDEDQRLRALLALKVLDSPNERKFDALVQAAALVCGVPISLVSLIDADRQWFKANVGLEGVSETPRDAAFCAHAILQGDLLEVPDARADARFADNPLVRGAPDIRFYAGAPLRLHDGSSVGTLCVIDRQPRQLDDTQRQVLRQLAIVAVEALESRRLAQGFLQSEARFRALSEAAPLGVFAADDQGACTYTNACWQAIYGLSEAESLGHGWSRALHPEDRAAVFEEWQRSALAQQNFDMEFRVRRDDGSTVAVRCIARPVAGADGRSAGCVGSVEDVTERRRVWQALQDERQRLAAIIDGTGAGTWEWNVQTGETRFNERWAGIVGLSLSDLGTTRVEHWHALAHPDDLARSRQALERHFSGEAEAYECEARMRHRNGQWVWVMARGRVLTRTDDGAPEWMLGTHLDITLRKRQEEELRRQQELLDRTGRLARVGGWELDVLTSALRWSAETRRIHGLPHDHQPALDEAIASFTEDCRPVLQQAVEQAIAHGTPWDLELQVQRPDGQRIWARSVGTAERVHGRVVRLYGAMQDISERHAMDQFLAQKTAELKRSNEELERFAYVTSHDLQEPLRMVTSYGQLLARRYLPTLPDEAREFVGYMVDGGQRAQALIRDLLSLARLDSQAQPWTEVPLQDVLAEALRPLRLRVQETGARITHDPLPVVLADARQINQLMANLLGNALKFTGPEPPAVHVGARREGHGWCISVRDNGIGIEPRYFERIFQMFQRLHLRSEYEGTGIGLAICKKVVERHGGRIGVDSTPGQGATFHFTLPDQPGARPPDPALAGPAAPVQTHPLQALARHAAPAPAGATR